MDPLARTATFRVEGWDDSRDVPYRVALTHEGEVHSWAGTIRRDPRDAPELVVAAFTGNNDLGFPHADVVRNVRHFEPDLLVFTGDNIYERVADYGIERAPLAAATLDYLRKWYLFGWEYRELLRDIPAICLVDDHDVYQGNIWGAGGRHATEHGKPGQDQGGYTMPAAWVNMVQRTQTSHLPDPPDPTPVEQGIGVYYGHLLYGGAERRHHRGPQVEVGPGGGAAGGEDRERLGPEPRLRPGDRGRRPRRRAPRGAPGGVPRGVDRGLVRRGLDEGRGVPDDLRQRGHPAAPRRHRRRDAAADGS